MAKVNKMFYAIMVAALLLGTSAFADTIKLEAIGSNHDGVGTATVPYFISVNGGGSITAMCDDFTHEVAVGESWSGHVFTYADLTANFASTRAGTAAPNGLGLTTLAAVQTVYKQLFWLFSQFQANPNDPTASDINLAAWAILDPALNGDTGHGWTVGASSWLAAAQMATNYNSVNTALFEIVSPANMINGNGTNPFVNSSPQEYIIYTPEPAGLFLLGSGLIGMGSFIRRKIA